MAQPPIEDHGIIGDLHTTALVARDGTIDFLCFPRFDSPSVFAALLDEKVGGSFSIAPSFDHARTRQLYLPDSNILLSRFLSSDGVVEISDLMPIEKACGKAHDLVRRVKVVRGEARVSLRCDPRFDYGRAKRETTRSGNDVIFRSLGPDKTVLRLQGTVPLSVDADGAARAEFVLRTNEHAAFVLDDALGHSHTTEGLERFVSTTFKHTLNYWRSWIHGCTYQGRWRETVRRSALTLKLLSSSEFGSLVAAPTFGLPEAIGGARNWDYRYTWIRDAAFTLEALQQIGFLEETTAFMEWIKGRVVAGGSPLQILYGLDGRTSVPEIELAHLGGYAGSQPVRIGNAAVDQLQLDIYGELIDAFDRYLSAGGSLAHEQWEILGRLADWVCDHWQTPDQGLWESRGPPGEFLHSRAMCWVALARMLRIAQRRSLPAPVARWTSVRDEIHVDIHQRFWNPARNSFVLSPGTSVIDASCLRLPLVGFIDATDARWKGTMRAVQEDLVVDSLVQRYRLDGAFWDGVGGPEGSFPMCTLWYAQCLARAGDVQQARYVFEKLLGYANHLGLFAEEIGITGEQLGNFPQAFTHLALISAACDLDARIDAAEK